MAPVFETVVIAWRTSSGKSSISRLPGLGITLRSPSDVALSSAAHCCPNVEVNVSSNKVFLDIRDPKFNGSFIEKGDSVLARLAAVVLKHRGKSRSEITLAVESAAREETVHLHAGIGVLDTVITIAPLLGLLGTASGLVLIFQGLGDNSDHLAIARGIAEALTTTIFGLAIAVPSVIAHGYFIRRIETLTARLETLLASLTSVCEKPNPNA